jgi:LemA protein
VPPIVYIGIAATSFVLVYGLWTFNRFVGLRNRLREAWSGIDVQLKRRHDLIPNLVEVTKGYRAHEQNVFQQVAEARTRAMASGGVATAQPAENELTRSLRSLFAVAEAYPQLKADANYRQLSDALTAVENDIQYARRYYNGTVRDYNILAQSFPSILVARACAFAPAQFFEIEIASERTAPEVRE